jgi:hypothetical protein
LGGADVDALTALIAERGGGKVVASIVDTDLRLLCSHLPKEGLGTGVLTSAAGNAELRVIG